MKDDLDQFERRIHGLPAAELPADLRRRVMRAVNAELVVTQRRTINWYWPAVAAVVVIVINLSMVAASRNAFSVRPAPNGWEWGAEIHATQSLSAQQEGLFK